MDYKVQYLNCNAVVEEKENELKGNTQIKRDV